MSDKHVVIVGAGFAGFACARKLIEHEGIHVTLLDRHNYHQFTPLLYQVATGELAAEDVATSLKTTFKGNPRIDIKLEEVMSVDPKTKTVKCASGNAYTGDYLVLAAGSIVNYFDTKGANGNSFPLYSLEDAERLRSRVLSVLAEAESTPSLIDKGALNFVIVGAGPTGTELAGALADLQLANASIYVVDYGHAVLGHFSEKSQKYAADVLQERKVKLLLGVGVKEVQDDSVLLTNGTKILSRTVVWAGGLKAVPLTQKSGLTLGHGDRIQVLRDLTVSGYSGLYAIGDVANMPNEKGECLPQLASVAQQSGVWAAKNIQLEIAGKPRLEFAYDDRGIMAMIGRNAAVAELGTKRHQLEGVVAFAAWLGVHAALMTSVRQRINAFMEWAWQYFGKKPNAAILDRPEESKIDWSK